MIGVPLNEPGLVSRKSTFEVFDEIRHKGLLSSRPLVIGSFDLFHIETKDYTIYAALIICI